MALLTRVWLALLLAAPACAQMKVQVAPVPIGPHGAYFIQIRTQVQTLLAVPGPLAQAFQATLLPQPEIRTPAAFAARAAIVGALARPGGIQELAQAIEGQGGRKAHKAGQALGKLAEAIGDASRSERVGLAAKAKALEARFDGATAAPGESVDLSLMPTNDEDGPGERKSVKQMKADRKDIAKLQEMLDSGKARGVLVVMQGIDGGGKGGVSKRPLRLNPAWTRLNAFKKPTAEEASQHFLKRIEAAFPVGGPKGIIQIFDRSHYEDLVMPTLLGTHTPEEIEARYPQIMDFERRLAEAGIVVVKLFLNVSYDEQERRLDKRIEDPEKHMKAAKSDWEIHGNFKKFLEVWGGVIARTSSPYAIWNVVANDFKPRGEADIARIVVKTLKRMGLAWGVNPDLGEIRSVRDRIKAKNRADKAG